MVNCGRRNLIFFFVVFYTPKIVSVAALHVLPAYRKMGLGRLVLMSLALVQVRLARSILDKRGPDASPIDDESIMAHADCIDDNYPTMVFMERCGWTRVGNHNWLGVGLK